MKNVIIILTTIISFLSICQTNTLEIKLDNVSQAKGTFALITNVETKGQENAYTFEVGISSPDTGCDKYADWWEVITEDGQLLYRRILGHSHVTEQPFIRSGGRVNITAKQIVIVRAHMNTLGYGTQAFKGSVSTGFLPTTLSEDFAKELASKKPVPSGCAF